MSSTRDGPPLLRPIPRRPFNLNLTQPTPPEEEEQEESQPYTPAHVPVPLNLDSLNRRLLDPRFNNAPHLEPGTPSSDISRAQSYLNLTSSALFGIYSPTTYGRDGLYADQDEQSTPWGTGAETPAKRLSVDEPYYRLQKERGRAPGRRRSTLQPPSKAQRLSRPAAAAYSGLRVLLLFGLGILYGALVARFQDSHNFGRLQREGSVGSTPYDLGYMTFWGISGIVLGTLLPWFDGVWEGVFGDKDGDESAIESVTSSQEGGNQDTDWALVMRGVGAFVGIVFAIRKLQWTSTLQLSLTLALVNPFLWYLIDQTKPGFLLSAVVGLAGSAILMGIRTDMVPAPAQQSWLNGHVGRNSSTESLPAPLMLGGLATQETVETGIWTLSILFCCCVCFGNIGRRLTLNGPGQGKGRWAERKTG